MSTGIEPLLGAAGESFQLHTFTNSNATHQAVWSRGFADTLDVFTSILVSSEIGRRKPEREAFDFVAATIGVRPDAVLFLDDSLENVVGARGAGMHAVHVTSIDSVRTALVGLGVVPDA